MLHPGAVQRPIPAMMLLLMLAASSLGLLGSCAASRMTRPQVDLMLEASTGEPILLQARRGRPVLLFLFATYDAASQFALMPLSDAFRAREGLDVLGIALQPDAGQLIGMLSESLSVAFPISYDPDERVIAGDTALGDVPGVPYYILLDREGRVQATHVGALVGAALQAFLDQAER